MTILISEAGRVAVADKRESCKHWQTVEDFMIWYRTPVQYQLCTLRELRAPDCAACGEWEASRAFARRMLEELRERGGGIEQGGGTGEGEL